MTEHSSDLVKTVANLLIDKNLLLVTAESCTGGLIAATCTELPGSSQWFDRGFVTYSNQAKQDMLGVPAHIIDKYGAVSQQVVEAMARGAYIASGGENRISVSVSGIAGPDGGTPDKPVGTVWIGLFDGNAIYSRLLQLSGSRSEIRTATLNDVLGSMLVSWLSRK
ncbi:damage-inducible protein CinA [Kangiella profundi]|uniref:Damage-inducible protein CinA n=1 Tax=Kangiella profundi TaxID=1561924 RepID=A0A2K9AYL5_9GAMM|nr:CinA family protein [Kangiella profundi]AUD78959.1 damage-inducible protein CinA [Kangiella profundi]